MAIITQFSQKKQVPTYFTHVHIFFPVFNQVMLTNLQVAAASGLIDGESVGEFKRSSSARLHRNKRNHPEFFNLDEDKRREQREESMKRLLEWKQRMLQSPLTRKSSR